MDYLVLDKTNNIVRSFESYSEANNYRNIMQRPDWSIAYYTVFVQRLH